MTMRQPDWRKRQKAYNAIERDTFSPDPAVASKADAALLKLKNRTLDAEAFWYYVASEEDWQLLNK